MNEKKNNNFKIIIITIAVTIVVFFVLINYGTIVKTFYPPDPKVVSHEINDSHSTLFEYSAMVEAVIRNDGGDGDIVLEATVYQDGNNWTKSAKKYFMAKETSKMELQFDEVKLLKGKYSAQMKVYPFGK